MPSDKAVVFVDNHDNQRGGNITYADGANYGFPAGTTVIVVASPGSRYPWGNPKGTWVPFYYNKQWHLYRSWCQ